MTMIRAYGGMPVVVTFRADKGELFAIGPDTTSSKPLRDRAVYVHPDRYMEFEAKVDECDAMEMQESDDDDNQQG